MRSRELCADEVILSAVFMKEIPGVRARTDNFGVFLPSLEGYCCFHDGWAQTVPRPHFSLGYLGHATDNEAHMESKVFFIV